MKTHEEGPFLNVNIFKNALRIKRAIQITIPKCVCVEQCVCVYQIIREYKLLLKNGHFDWEQSPGAPTLLIKPLESV